MLFDFASMMLGYPSQIEKDVIALSIVEGCGVLLILSHACPARMKRDGWHTFWKWMSGGKGRCSTEHHKEKAKQKLGEKLRGKLKKNSGLSLVNGRCILNSLSGIRKRTQ
jgi:hypothetical protein